MKQAGLISIEPPVLPRQATTMLLGILKVQYRPTLINYPTLEGGIYLLYTLYLTL